MLLFQIHSVLRYLILIAGLAALGVIAVGASTSKPAGKSVRIAGAVFVGLFDLQILVGIAVMMTRPYYPALIGHVVMMLSGATLTHVMLAKNRRRAQPGYRLPIIGIGIALAFVMVGITAIGRGVLAHTAF
jgi:hypothetical protein